MHELEEVEGIGPSIAKKMRDRGIFNALDLATADSNQLIEDKVTDSRDSANKFIESAKALLENGDFQTADTVLESREKNIKKLNTGSQALNDLLKGGIETHSVTEFYGEFGSGKSQICHTLAVLSQLPPESSGLNGGAIYIDTEGTFRPERIKEMVKTRFPDKDPSLFLKNIFVGKAYNTEKFWWFVKTAGKWISETNAKLLIVDSLTSLHRAEYIGRGQLNERQQHLNRIIHKLTRIADYFGIAVVFTNQVMSAPDVFFGNPTKAVGGHIVAHGSTYRVFLMKGGANKIATIVDSPCHAYSNTRFTITEKGVEDIPEKEKKKEVAVPTAQESLDF